MVLMGLMVSLRLLSYGCDDTLCLSVVAHILCLSRSLCGIHFAFNQQIIVVILVLMAFCGL